ncbi:MAG: pyridoxamine 5'-phosphate oxidase family protein [Phycisphaerales bacterium]
MTRHAAGPIDSIAELADYAREAIVRGAESARHPFHTPVLVTVEPNGEPAARTVVLRVGDPADGLLLCHTDSRSPKLRDIAHQPLVVWVFYDAEARLQVRARCLATVHTDDALADERWAASSLSSRRCYLGPRPPGTPSSEPSANLPADVRTRVPDEARAATGRGNFAVIRGEIMEVDVLHLHHAGHRRALFSLGRDTKPVRWTGTWIEP